MRVSTCERGTIGAIVAAWIKVTPRVAGVAPRLTLGLALASCLFGQTSPSGAGAAKSYDPLNRESPQSSAYSFLEACHSRNYVRAAKYLDLRRLPEDQRLRDGPELAQQLEQILDRDARFDVAALTREPLGDEHDASGAPRESVDTFDLNGVKVKLEMERATLHSGTAIWLFSSDSVRAIPKLAAMTSTSPIERYLPPMLVNWKLLDTPLWRWIALALLTVLLAVFSRLLSRLLLVAVADPLTRRFAPGATRGGLDNFISPLRLLLSVAVFRAAMAWTGPSALLRLWLSRALAFLFFMSLAWLSMEIIDLAGRRARVTFAAKHQSFSYSMLPLVSRILKLTIFCLAVAAILGDWGYNTTTILAGLGVGGIAIALAAQKTIENFFGGVSVIGDRPVSVGDYCKFGDRGGTIEDIGLRSTRIRTVDRTLVVVPNGIFSAMTLENFSQRDKMLFHVTLNLLRNTTPDQVRELLESLGRILAENKKVETGNVPVRFIGVGAYSLDVEIFVYILTRDGDEFTRIQQDLLLRILDAVADAGTALALPTQASISYPYRDGDAEQPAAAPPRVASRQPSSNGAPDSSRK